ncbi:hypothetical protein HS088_TW11G00370 [Tripterygium wilfordii]|uniref:Uncharacterized protein n=1 Tax=Tripterygium wilfordii TaxID=458696 RepID=A0A7J7D1V2_TRIWF|nr:uncharacterized protein LOC120009916 [Tripterygium wilfordii]KAF5740303.1 hypothetical protein HS088_TW11G00370 [Tripterygium wilfordii]
MRGVGGPLLCIGDLLSDLGEEEAANDVAVPDHREASPIPNYEDVSQSSLDLAELFKETYDRLDKALAGTDHSWTALTLKLCSALETANKLVQSTNANVSLLSEKVGKLEGIVKRGDSAVSAAKAVHLSLNQKEGPSSGSPKC